MTFFSTTIIPTATPQIVMTNKNGITKATQIQVRVRSMGDATVISLGGSDSQDRRMTGAGDNVGIDTPLGKRYLDLRSLWISSDGTTPVVEIIGDSYGGVD
jgi:hypothetical protein